LKEDIGYVYQDDYPWDIRIDKITSSFVSAGHPTTIICKNSRRERKRETLENGVRLHRLTSHRSALANSLLGTPAFFSPVWISTVSAAVREHGIRALFVRDLPLAPAAIYVGKKARVPVIMDMAEDYPEMIQDTWTFRGPRPVDYVIRNPTLLRMLERWVLPRLTAVLTVSEESQDRVRKLGCAKTCVIGNTPRNHDQVEDRSCEISRRLRNSKALTLLYVGGMEESRGLDEVIEALPECRAKLGAVELTIVGDGTSRLALERRVQELGLTASVHFEGFVDQGRVPGIIGAADIGLIPHKLTKHINTTIPNKIYDYMERSKPVIASNAAPLVRLIDEHHCGVYFTSGSRESLVRAVCSLSDARHRQQLGDAGAKAVSTSLNWETDAGRLVEFTDSVLTEFSRAL
jgi:glycosyltransferase involved in cell wall biosynthesis